MTHGPPDDVLGDLGRITWEAITVEDRVYQDAGHVFMDPEGESVGTCIGKTIKKLKQLGPHPDLDEAIAWLEEARAALDDRNAVMHGLPMISYVRTAAGTMAPNGQMPSSTSDEGIGQWGASSRSPWLILRQFRRGLQTSALAGSR